jgi:hypothetical protein
MMDELLMKDLLGRNNAPPDCAGGARFNVQATEADQR